LCGCAVVWFVCVFGQVAELGPENIFAAQAKIVVLASGGESRHSLGWKNNNRNDTE
jgi:hypothetical protein